LQDDDQNYLNHSSCNLDITITHDEFKYQESTDSTEFIFLKRVWNMYEIGLLIETKWSKNSSIQKLQAKFKINKAMVIINLQWAIK